jgi:hypothetical protein
MVPFCCPLRNALNSQSRIAVPDGAITTFVDRRTRIPEFAGSTVAESIMQEVLLLFRRMIVFDTTDSQSADLTTTPKRSSDSLASTGCCFPAVTTNSWMIVASGTQEILLRPRFV